MISELQILDAKNSLKKLLETSNDRITCEIINTLKSINGLDNLNQEKILNKIVDNNIKAIVKSCF
ncbi:MAG: hypothetical protein L6V95_03595 [Candidatus Melainabacteria bacterium]|nr:MAG: hypothetical protein L6V95_03595 [Candidatus Melainabacteria bacterium]